MVSFSLLLLLSFITFCSLSNGNCIVVQGSMPENGMCNGPTERAIVKLENAETFNANCPNNQVQYFKDNDPNVSLCGECVPGTSGAEDSELLCGINQFCNDNATCQDTKTSPMYNEPCPYELGN